MSGASPGAAGAHGPSAGPGDGAVQAMAAYYAQRAAIYERVYHKPARQAELRQLEAQVGACFAGRHVLELACGTGWWTPHGAARAASWLATDLSRATMAVAQTKALPAGVSFETIDVYDLQALDGRRFDAAFTGCWWSHVPRARLDHWLAELHARLAPGAKVLMLDNRYVEGDSTPVTRRDADGNGYQRRRLDDGSVHEVLKNYPVAKEAFARLGPRAHDMRWAEHLHYWTLSYTLA